MSELCVKQEILIRDLDPLLLTQIIFTSIGIRAWIDKYTHLKERDIITHPFPNFMLNYDMDEWSHPQKTMDLITYPNLNRIATMLIVGTPAL